MCYDGYFVNCCPNEYAQRFNASIHENINFST
jgi:hypothetical protein